MAERPQNKNLKKFKKGQSGNPEGGRKHNPDVKALKNLTKKELVEVGNLVIKGDLAGLKELAKASGTPVLTVWLCAVCIKGIEKGDVQALDVLLNRLIGKVKDEIEMSGDVVNPPQIIVTLPANGREAK